MVTHPRDPPSVLAHTHLGLEPPELLLGESQPRAQVQGLAQVELTLQPHSSSTALCFASYVPWLTIEYELLPSLAMQLLGHGRAKAERCGRSCIDRGPQQGTH